MKKNFIPFVLACGAMATSCSAPAGSNANACADSSSCCQKACIKGEWNIVSASGLSTDSCDRVFVAFADSNKVNGNSGVNSFFGEYAKSGDSLSFKNIGQTMMMGSDAAAKVEAAVTKALNTTATVKVNGDTATAFNAGGEAVLVMVKAKQACILGEWDIVSAKGLKADTTTTAQRAFLAFGDSSKVTGCTGVNQLMGSFEFSGDKLTFSNVASTKMMAGPFRQMEANVMEVIASAASIAVQGNEATIFDAKGEAVMVLAKTK